MPGGGYRSCPLERRLSLEPLILPAFLSAENLRLFVVKNRACTHPHSFTTGSIQYNVHMVVEQHEHHVFATTSLCTIVRRYNSLRTCCQAVPGFQDSRNLRFPGFDGQLTSVLPPSRSGQLTARLALLALQKNGLILFV